MTFESHSGPGLSAGAPSHGESGHPTSPGPDGASPTESTRDLNAAACPSRHGEPGRGPGPPPGPGPGAGAAASESRVWRLRAHESESVRVSSVRLGSESRVRLGGRRAVPVPPSRPPGPGVTSRRRRRAARPRPPGRDSPSLRLPSQRRPNTDNLNPGCHRDLQLRTFKLTRPGAGQTRR